MTLFTENADVSAVLNDRLMLVARQYFPRVTFSKSYVFEKLLAEEKMMERALRTFLTPREMLPTGAEQSEIDALVAAGNDVVMEPGYDYNPNLFQGNTWGLIELRQRPIIEVHSITFDYPTPQSTLFTIPLEWVRADMKYGIVNLVPVQTAISLPLNAFILSALGGGRTVPLMLQVRYSAGIVDVKETNPDIVDLIKKAAVLSILDDAYIPQGGSASVDGLSQNLNFQADKYRDEIERRREALRQSLEGVRVSVI